jgi:INO80 complex subunit Ies4
LILIAFHAFSNQSLTMMLRDDGATENNGKTSGGGPTNGTHKLGPKANQGAINAGLRALDRSGKPCRKWERKPIQLKSFTGVVWELPSWRAPKSRLLNEESHESKQASPPSGSKANDSSTAMDSEKSNAGENGARPMMESTPAASSPVLAPAPLAPTVVATG